MRDGTSLEMLAKGHRRWSGDMDETTLSKQEQARLERFQRMHKNRRGRKNPAVMPSKLARTAAFAPRKKGLITDSSFSRVYAVKPHAVVEVRGRELGSQHRDALYALFRLRARRQEVPNPQYDPRAPTTMTSARPKLVYWHTDATWRQLLAATGRTAHVNNLATMLRVLEEIRNVTFRVFEGDWDSYEASRSRGRLASAGFSDNLLGLIEWSGVDLDSSVTVRYGDWVRQMFEAKNLVSLNGDVYFRLRSDYAKAIWPFLDSQPRYDWVGVETLSELCGRDYSAETTRQRVKFREEVRQAFDDMVTAGGLSSWDTEEVGSGRAKSYRYRFTHSLPLQGALLLQAPDGKQLDPSIPANKPARSKVASSSK